MKQIIFFLSTYLILLLIACNPAGTHSDTAVNASPKISTDDESKRMLDKNEQVYRAIETGNFNGLDTIMANDVVDHSAPGGKEMKGKDSIIAILKNISSSIKNGKVETKASSYDPAKGIVFALVRMTGTSTNGMSGIPVNTAFDMTMVDVVKMTDGKISEHWSFEDPAQTMEMMAKQSAAKH